MKLEEMSNMDLAYVEGFIGKCAAHNVDPELFLEALMSKSAQVEVQKPMPGGSDTGPAQQPNTSTYVPSNANVGRKVKGMTLPKLGAAEEEEKPDYEKRRRMTNVAMGAIPAGAAGGILGAISGSAASKKHPNLGAALGGVAGAAGGAALGGGAAMIYNAIRNSLGFSAMGAPIKLQTNTGL